MQLFAYGTLMFPEVWRAVAGRDFRSVAGTARGFAAYRVRDAVYPGIISAGDDAIVRGVLYFDVDETALDRLDRFEDDFYVRQILTIACDDGCERQADAYVVPTERGSVLTNEPWTRESFIASGGLEKFVGRFAGYNRMQKVE